MKLVIAITLSLISTTAVIVLVGLAELLHPARVHRALCSQNRHKDAEQPSQQPRRADHGNDCKLRSFTRLLRLCSDCIFRINARRSEEEEVYIWIQPV